MFVDYQLMLDDPDVTDSPFPDGTKGCIFAGTSDDYSLFAYLEYPANYVWDATTIQAFKTAMADGSPDTTFVDNGNYIIFSSQNYKTYN